MTVIQIIFGLSRSAVSLYIRFGRRVLIEALRKNPSAKVEIPNEKKIAEYKEAVKREKGGVRGLIVTHPYLSPSIPKASPLYLD